MSQADNPYANWGTIAARAETSERADFIRKTYLHLAGAVAAFIAIEAVLMHLPGVEKLPALMFGNRWTWFVVIGAFMGVSYIATNWAQSSTSPTTQYMGLGLYVVAEAVIFLPLLYIAHTVRGFDNVYQGLSAIQLSAAITGVIFAGLTAIVFATGADFSFLRTGLMLAMFAALGIALCSALFGFNLNLVFIAALVVLACGYILYDTSNVLHHYCIGQHVAASLALFASVALLFWYILQIVMRLSSRD
jgi:FtsH-binding integral membrane protein